MGGGLISSRILKAIAIQQSRLTINAFVDRNLRGLTRSRRTGNSLQRATPSRRPGAETREVFHGDQSSDLRCVDRNGSGDSRNHVRSGLGSDAVASAMKVIAQSPCGNDAIYYAHAQNTEETVRGPTNRRAKVGID